MFKCENRFSSSIRKGIHLLLAVQMVIAPELSYALETNKPNLETRPKSQSVPTSLKQLQAEDPIWNEFLEIAPQSDDLSLNFDLKDPAIDRDPFFLREQRWSKLSEPNQYSDFSFRKNNGKTQLLLPQTNKLLVLDPALTPFAITEEFIFLSLDKGSDLFQKAAGLGQKPGEGIFFVDRKEYIEKAALNQPLPIYFFPLPDVGWTGSILSHELPNADTLAIANSKGDAIAIELKDVETLMTAERINLMLATASTLKDTPITAAQSFLPAEGSTAAFGLFYTGNTSDLKVAHSVLERASGWFMANLQKIPMLFASQSQRAHAVELSPDFVHRIVFVGSILTGMLALSVVLKYAHPGIKRKILIQRAARPEAFTLGQKAGREIREIFDVFAHVTTTSSQVQAVTTGNAIEMFIDRFAPSVGAADHTLIRRFMNNSYFFTRSNVMKSPVNAKTFFLGSIVFGGMDTSFVVIQYFVAVPWLCQWASQYVNAYWQAKIDHTFDPSNPNTAQVATIDSIRNGLSYLQNGASSYSIDSRTQVIEAVTEQVEAQLRKIGKDPKDPVNQSLRERMIEETTDLLLRQRGLPGADQFLFDTNSIYSVVPKAFGYGTPDQAAVHDSFILAKRYTLTYAALERAIAKARAFALEHPSATALDAVILLEETAQKTKLIQLRRKSADEHDATSKAVRQQLTLLSYEGPISWGSRYLPDTWSRKTDPESVEAAALFFRQALYSYLDKEGTNLMGPSPELAAKYAQQARENVIAKMRSEDPKLQTLSRAEAEKSILNEKDLELHVRTELEIMDMARAKAKETATANYKPTKEDWFTKRQMAKAEKIANERMGKSLYESTLNSGSSLDKDIVVTSKKQYYRDAIAEQVGLHLLTPEVLSHLTPAEQTEYSAMMTEVEKIAEENTQSEIASHAGLKNYLGSLNELERSRIEISLYANNFLAAYQSATTQKQLVSPLSPAQPGSFQRLRQTHWVIKSRFLTRAVRTIESLNDDQTLSLGFHNSLRRNIPLFSDMWSSHRRLLKRIIPSMTTAYLWNFYVMQLNLPFATWLVFVSTGAATIDVPSLWLNRVFRMNNLKAMDDWKSKALFALPYGWLTFFGMIPMMLLSQDVNSLFTTYLTDPIHSTLGQVDPEHWIEGAAVLGASVIAKKVYKILSDRKAKQQFERDITDKLVKRQSSAIGILGLSPGRLIRCQQSLLAH